MESTQELREHLADIWVSRTGAKNAHALFCIAAKMTGSRDPMAVTIATATNRREAEVRFIRLAAAAKAQAYDGEVCGRCGGHGTYGHYGTCFDCGGRGWV